MSERLVVLSDMWGSRQGLWITSYLGALQQHFDIVYYDSQELAGIDLMVKTRDNLCEALLEGGYETAVSHLLAKEKTPSHYLTFCAGGSIAWRAALRGLPVKSLFSISPLWLDRQTQKPDCPVTLVYGERHKERPDRSWAEQLGVPMFVESNFGRELYSDEKIINKVCQQLLHTTVRKQQRVMPMKQLSAY